MKKLLLLAFLTFIFLLNSVKTYAAEPVDYDSIYNNMPVLVDIYYDHNEDPDENLDYQDFIQSPYPLMRVSVKLKCKDVKLNPGYYLVTVKNRSNYDFAMLKQRGKIVALVPIYEKQKIDPETFYPKPQKPKKSVVGKAGSGIKTVIAFPFKPLDRFKKPPPQTRHFITSSLVDGGRYFEIYVYQEDYLYKILFQVER
ncbi:MAG: hypothetical protein ACD_20C00007G0001 [uncultured bacterium]|nr:MAG: hypothetical protein ACD_20C00007G0001 [uncultured bacterium]HBH19157.1 hypothetical protein [Cyanobacteria bacterium UBA9579]